MVVAICAGWPCGASSREFGWRIFHRSTNQHCGADQQPVRPSWRRLGVHVCFAAVARPCALGDASSIDEITMPLVDRFLAATGICNLQQLGLLALTAMAPISFGQIGIAPARPLGGEAMFLVFYGPASSQSTCRIRLFGLRLTATPLDAAISCVPAAVQARGLRFNRARRLCRAESITRSVIGPRTARSAIFHGQEDVASSPAFAHRGAKPHGVAIRRHRGDREPLAA